MRMFDDRYSRDRRRFEIALRFIQLEARTHTIRAWTGLTDDRIRKLYRTYLSDSQGVPLTRHRGKSPQQSGFFTRTARARQESALLASLWRLIGALPALPGSEIAQRLPGLNRGELLCQGYDSYRALVPAPMISFEHAVFLLTALARGEELKLGTCGACGLPSKTPKSPWPTPSRVTPPWPSCPRCAVRSNAWPTSSMACSSWSAASHPGRAGPTCVVRWPR